MTELAHWLDARRPAPPPTLRHAMDEALAAGDPGTGDPADRLAAAALATLRAVAKDGSDRSTAPALLAADALLTYACEAAAEAGTLDRLTAALDPARFASILEPDTES